MHPLLAAIPFPPFDPVALRLGPFTVRWYGLAYLAAFLLGFLLLRQMVRSGRLRIVADQLGDLMLWLIAGVMLGGRLGWWVYYHRGGGSPGPWYEPLAIWHGEMSFHGGLAGVIVGLLVWAWRTRSPFWNLADALALVAPVGLFLGRLANFVNAELVGRPTDLQWGVLFPGELLARHPSQLYEALLEGPFLLALLCLAARRGVRDGRVAGLFLALYGVIRFAVEFTRQPDAQIGFIAFGWLTMGQALSIFVAAGGAVVAVVRTRSSFPEGLSTAVHGKALRA